MPEGELEVWSVIVAAGSGERLDADRPKAFVRLGNRTLVAASLEAFEEHPGVSGVVCVVPEGWEDRLSAVVDDLAAGKVAAAVAGGSSRAESVRRGLELVPEGVAFVLVHDAARPLVTTAVIDAVLIGLAEGADGVVPSLAVTDTVKRVGGDGTVVETLHRADLRAAQTPQGFPAGVLRRAFATAGADAAVATDCASLVERAGGRVICVAGDPQNIKVTTRADLHRAAELLADRAD